MRMLTVSTIATAGVGSLLTVRSERKATKMIQEVSHHLDDRFSRLETQAHRIEEKVSTMTQGASGVFDRINHFGNILEKMMPESTPEYQEIKDSNDALDFFLDVVIPILPEPEEQSREVPSVEETAEPVTAPLKVVVPINHEEAESGPPPSEEALQAYASLEDTVQKLRQDLDILRRSIDSIVTRKVQQEVDRRTHRINQEIDQRLVEFEKAIQEGLKNGTESVLKSPSFQDKIQHFNQVRHSR